MSSDGRPDWSTFCADLRRDYASTWPMLLEALREFGEDGG
jgi:hypothetical protein